MRQGSLGILGIVLITAARCFATSPGVPFTSEGIASLPGKDICTLQGKFSTVAGRSLDAKWEHSVEYRYRDGVIALFLLGKSGPPTYCGIVDAVVDLTPLIKSREVPYFKCHIDSAGPIRWGKVVGLADNHAGKRRFVKARLAWKVDAKERRFEQLKEGRVSCDTSGYIYGNGRY